MQENQNAGKSILLVEDERSVRDLLRQVLAADGHTVAEANNGVEALTTFRTSPFDLVIIDFGIPFMQGDELAVRLKQLAPQVPILMITGRAMRPSRSNPVNAVLAKPFDFAQLRHVVGELLEKQER